MLYFNLDLLPSLNWHVLCVLWGYWFWCFLNIFRLEVIISKNISVCVKNFLNMNMKIFPRILDPQLPKWSSWLRCYIQNWMDSGSNLTRCSTGLFNPTLFWGPQWTVVQNQYQDAAINIGLVKLPPPKWPKVDWKRVCPN